jgi:hypothetical protein
MATLKQAVFLIVIAAISAVAAGFVLWLLDQQGWIPEG